MLFIFAAGCFSSALVFALVSWLRHRAKPQTTTVQADTEQPDLPGREQGPPAINQPDAAEAPEQTVRNELMQLTLRRFIGACNRSESHNTLKQLANGISLLSANPLVNEPPREADILTLTDEIIELIYPLAERRCCLIHLNFPNHLPESVEIQGWQFQRWLLDTLLTIISKADYPTATTNLEMKLDCSDLCVMISISKIADTGIAANRGSDNSHPVNCDSITFPILASERARHHLERRDITALIICDNAIERRSMQCRLAALNIASVTAFNNSQPDFCLVCDEASKSYQAVLTSLNDHTPVFVLRSQQQKVRPDLRQLAGPPTQSRLAALIAELELLPADKATSGVLVVDDNQANAQLLAMQLTDLGYEATLALSGGQALQLLKKQVFSHVFMDIQMPEMDGVTATRRIRASGHEMPIIGLTAHATPSEIKAYLDAGFTDVLIKPARTETLQIRLRTMRQPSHLASRRPQAAGQAQSLPVIDFDLSLLNAGNRPEVASELLALLVENLPTDQAAINEAADHDSLKAAIHKLHGAVRYCGVPRLATAVEKLESAAKRNAIEETRVLINLVNGEISAVMQSYRDAPDLFQTDRNQRSESY